MKNPCLNCIVQACCNEKCDEYTVFRDDMIMAIKNITKCRTRISHTFIIISLILYTVSSIFNNYTNIGYFVCLVFFAWRYIKYSFIYKTIEIDQLWKYMSKIKKQSY